MVNIKLKKGVRVLTLYGKGCIVGYDLESFNEWRHIVKLDNGKLFGNNNPCFFNNQLSIIK